MKARLETKFECKFSMLRSISEENRLMLEKDLRQRWPVRKKNRNAEMKTLFHLILMWLELSTILCSAVLAKNLD